MFDFLADHGRNRQPLAGRSVILSKSNQSKSILLWRSTSAPMFSVLVVSEGASWVFLDHGNDSDSAPGGYYPCCRIKLSVVSCRDLDAGTVVVVGHTMCIMALSWYYILPMESREEDEQTTHRYGLVRSERFHGEVNVYQHTSTA